MHLDVKQVVSKLTKLEKSLRSKIENGVLVDEVKRFADSQSRVLRQKVKNSRDVKKVVASLEKGRKQLEKVAKELPREVQAIRSYVQAQRKEINKVGKELLARVKKAQGKPRASTTKKRAGGGTKKRAARKTSSKKAAR